MHFRRALIAGALALATTLTAQAMPTPDPQWTPVARATVLSRTNAVLSNYYYVDRVPALRAAVQAHRAALMAITDQRSFAEALTRDLQQASGDKHIIVWYSAQSDKNNEHRTTQAEQAETHRFFRYVNNGCDASIRLKGNIGYLRLGGFADLAKARPTLDAAMTLIANTNALIIDLRNNGGGDSDTVNYLLSYFVERRTELTTALERSGAQTIVHRNFTEAKIGGPRYLQRPIYVLVGPHTISGGELFAYELQTLHDATIIGERTAGAGNGLGSPPYYLTDHLRISIPDTILRNPRTGTSWEGIGVTPEVKTGADASLLIAYGKALRTISLTYDPLDEISQARRDPANALRESFFGQR